MKRACLLLVVMLALEAGAAEKPCPSPMWTVDLAARYGYLPFDPLWGGWGLPQPWQLQQGVVFISPEVLAVYQVLTSDELIPRGDRDESGGGGKYILQVVLLDTKSGEQVQKLRLITGNSDFSGVYPTHDGQFLIKTQGMLSLYSPAFQKVTSRPLPLSETATFQGWVVSVSPSGKVIRVQYSVVGEDYHTEDYLFDADTLESIPASEGSDGSQKGSDATNPLFEHTSCPREFGKLPGQVFFPDRCKKLELFSPDGRLLWQVPLRDEVTSVLYNGKLLAAEIIHMPWDPLDMGLQPKPRWIALYDLATKSEKCSIRISALVSNGWARSVFYGLSSAGTTAVIQGTKLSLYRP